MWLPSRLGLLTAIVACSFHTISAQELAPRAYLITPMPSNAIILTNAFYTGSVLIDGAIPITGASGTYSVPTFTYYYSFNFFGRSANVNGSLPYGIGTFQAVVIGEKQQVYRSGLADSEFRLAVNIKGAPAMPVQQFVKWKQKTLLGVSLKVAVPTGQYDAKKVVNWGSNRWASNRRLVIPSVGANGCSTVPQEYGSTTKTRGPFRSLFPSRNRRALWDLSKAT
jgi:hypothetical protein